MARYTMPLAHDPQSTAELRKEIVAGFLHGDGL
jgi:hypothetical protein